jgi:hypothetical protein
MQKLMGAPREEFALAHTLSFDKVIKRLELPLMVAYIECLIQLSSLEDNKLMQLLRA